MDESYEKGRKKRKSISLSYVGTLIHNFEGETKKCMSFYKAKLERKTKWAECKTITFKREMESKKKVKNKKKC